MCTIGIIGALTLNISLVTELLNFGGLVGFMCVNLSVIVYYFIKKKERRILFNLIIPALGFVVCFYLWINLSTFALTVGFAWLSLGVIYGIILSKTSKKKLPMINDM